MQIDFHRQENRYTYATRQADSSWMIMVNTIVAVSGRRVLDIGCGEGIYTKALADMGAASVTGLDSYRDYPTKSLNPSPGAKRPAYLFCRSIPLAQAGRGADRAGSDT